MAGMHLASHKRRKFQNVGKSSSCKSESASLHSPKLLKGMDDGKFGSVTKEYETLHAQAVQMINFLQTQQCPFANPGSSPGLKSSQYGSIACFNPSSERVEVNSDPSMSQHVIDLDILDDVFAADPTIDHVSAHSSGNCGSPMQKKMQHITSGSSFLCPKTKEHKDKTSVITIDSDDEDGVCQKDTKNSCISECQVHEFQAWLSSELHLRLRQAGLLAWEGHSNHPAASEQKNVKFAHDFAAVGKVQSSVQYEAVVLSKVIDKQPIQDLEVSLFFVFCFLLVLFFSVIDFFSPSNKSQTTAMVSLLSMTKEDN